MCDSGKKIIELDPCGNDIFAFASRKALTLYAEILQEGMPQVAEDLFALVEEEERENIKELHRVLKMSPITNGEEEFDCTEDSGCNTNNTIIDHYDNEVLKITVCDQLFVDLSKAAHQNDMTINDFCSEIIIDFMENSI